MTIDQYVIKVDGKKTEFYPIKHPFWANFSLRIRGELPFREIILVPKNFADSRVTTLPLLRTDSAKTFLTLSLRFRWNES